MFLFGKRHGKEKVAGVLQRNLLLLGICLMTGSLSACGSDTNVTIPEKEQKQAMNILDLGEPIRQDTVEEEQNGDLADREVHKDVMGATEAFEMGENADDNSVVSITISATGDVTLGTHQEQDYANSFTQAYDQAGDVGYFFENVYPIFAEDDCTIVNLEGPLTNSVDMREGQTYSIKGAPAYVDILTAGSVEAAAMGNNHRLDYKEQGSADTVALLEQANITYAYDDVTGIYETKGIRIGIVSVNEVYWGYGVEKTLENGIAHLQEEQVDLILACCHWGTEREYYPEDCQRILGQKCIDWGADLVIGHHPHVLQGIEEYKGKYIVHSLGNFCFGANRNPEDKDTMIFQQTFTFVDGVKQQDQEIQVIPCSISSVSSRNDFRPTPAQGEEAKRIINRINEMSLDFGVQLDENGRVSSVW